MYEVDRKKSIVLFGALILFVVGLSLIAYFISGNMGIEERFNSALGISTGPEEEGEPSGVFGFNIEGNSLHYLIVLSTLVILCLLIYMKNKNKF